MRKTIALLLVLSVRSAFAYPSNSIALVGSYGVTETTLVTDSEFPTESVGQPAYIISGYVANPPDQFTEPVTVTSKTVTTVVVIRPSPKTHGLSTQPRIVYYAPPTTTPTADPTVTYTRTRTLTPTQTFTQTPTSTATFTPTTTKTITATVTSTPSSTPWPTMAVNVGNIPGSALTIWNLNGGSGDESVSLSGTPGPLAVTTPGGKAVVVSDLNIPGNLSIGGHISGWLSADDISTSNIVDGSGLNLVGNSGTGPTLGNALENTLINGLSVSFGMNTVRGVPTPAYSDSAANKTYVDNLTTTGDTAIYTYAGVTILNIVNGIAVTNR